MIGEAITDNWHSKTNLKNGAAVTAANPKYDWRSQFTLISDVPGLRAQPRRSSAAEKPLKALHTPAIIFVGTPADRRQRRGVVAIHAFVDLVVLGCAFIFDAVRHAPGEPCFDFVFEPANRSISDAYALREPD